ncbi:MAG TPA: peptidase M48 [Deltaproteobacteria bacterium]|nr:peptidase M48 [Deltaproteobacteria bacterium]
MRNALPVIVILALGIALLTSCETVPITGRTQLSLVPAATVNSMGLDYYRDFMGKHKVTADVGGSESVRRVGTRIQQAVTRYFQQQGDLSRLEGYRWEFNLIEDPSINAFALPGGKVVVYTGILPVTRHDAGLAVVMGHEIAHILANHGAERMSQGLLAQMGGVALSEALATRPGQTRDLFLGAFGIGTQVGVLLPFSRLQESEADHLGLIFMAMAGYDPREAVPFWIRMSAAKQKTGGTPEFLSTHPTDANRIENIRRLIPQALPYYRRN